MIKNLPIICLTFFNFFMSAQKFVVTYGFPEVSTTTGTVDPSTTPTVTGLVFNSFSSTGASANPSATGRFSFTKWPIGGVDGTDDYSNFTGALSPTVYFEVSIAINPGYTLSLNTLSFSMRRSGTGIRHYCVRSNLDGYTNNLAASTGTATKLSVIPGDVFFWNYDSVSTSNDQKGSTITFGNQFKTLTQPITFRFFAWNAESSGGSFSIDNVSFDGSVLDSLILLNVPIDRTSNSFNKPQTFPNPSRDGTIAITFSEPFNSLEIISLTGTKLLEYNSQGIETTKLLNLSDFESGIYFLKTNSSGSSTISKIILSHK
ncbi:T9SS type A sorting domain-containing protein [Aurantibacillus circumpalustris]|uniref:T9SS type A sorting domain-containing protein n=1 Tax=Aurantibacillus circumpalustris TaxID=3036359 RepID=UPI00295C36F2|nr:T9SS type A sorting domain-containing protein [Aurantibacillus circumpalustris]